MLVACEFLIPVVADSTRQPFPADVVSAWESELVTRFGGFTLRGIVSGAWADDAGLVVTDESRCYLVAVAPERLDDLRAFLREACKVFDQRVIYFQMVGKAELLGPA